MQRVLAELIAREVKDPRVGNVTITAVESRARPGACARVFFTPFASRTSGRGGARGSDARGRVPARRGRPAPRPAACAAAGVRVRRHASTRRLQLTEPINRCGRPRDRGRARRAARTSPCAQRHPAARQAPRAVVERGAAAGAPPVGRRQGRPCRQPRSARHRHAADLPRRGHQDRRRHPRGAQALPLHHRLGHAHGHRGCRRARSSRAQPVPALTRPRSSRALQRFRGAQSQMPPMYSALKRDGQPLYKLARAGSWSSARRARSRSPSLRLLAFDGGGAGARGAVLQGHLHPRPGGGHRARPRHLRPRHGLRRAYVEPFELEPMHTLESIARPAPRAMRRRSCRRTWASAISPRASGCRARAAPAAGPGGRRRSLRERPCAPLRRGGALHGPGRSGWPRPSAAAAAVSSCSRALRTGRIPRLQWP